MVTRRLVPQVRQWWSETPRGVHGALAKFTEAHVSPSLLGRTFKGIEEARKATTTTTARSHRHTNSVPRRHNNGNTPPPHHHHRAAAGDRVGGRRELPRARVAAVAPGGRDARVRYLCDLLTYLPSRQVTAMHACDGSTMQARRGPLDGIPIATR